MIRTGREPDARRSWLPALAWFAAGAIIGVAASFVALGKREPVQPPLTLTGAGASFPYPLYRRWFAAYGDSTGQRINYFSVGSAGGIFALSQGDVDFGASDRLLRASEIAAMPCGDPIAIPTAIGAVALAYHLPPLDRALRLDDATIAAMFGGSITQWDDARVRALNPHLTLPAIPVRVVHRSDGSGTTRVFLSFLGRHAAAWSSPSGDEATRWPAGSGVSGNEGVAAEVQVTLGAIGYVEVSYARQLRLPAAEIRNAAGAFVLPTSGAMMAAAHAAFQGRRADSVTSLLGATNADAYPIASLTWLLIPPQARDTVRSNAVFAFARWALARPPSEIEQLGYAPLPRTVAAFYAQRLRDHAVAVCPPRTILPREGI